MRLARLGLFENEKIPVNLLSRFKYQYLYSVSLCSAKPRRVASNHVHQTRYGVVNFHLFISAVRRTGAPSSQDATSTDPPKERNSVERMDWRSFSSLLAICAFSMLWLPG